MKACHRCGSSWGEPGQPGFNNTCSKCGMALHACMNCHNFVPRGSVRCMVPTAPQVLDPSAANRCNLFEFSQIQSTAATREPVPTAFFGSAAPPIARDSASARRRFNQLFGET